MKDRLARTLDAIPHLAVIAAFGIGLGVALLLLLARG